MLCGCAPVVGAGTHDILLHLYAALGTHVILVHVFLQASHHARMPVRDIRAEVPDLRCARLLHGELEVDVLRHADLRPPSRV